MIADKLSSLLLDATEVEYNARGFHAQHTASADTLPQIADAFLSEEFHLEMITCQDRRENDNTFRLIYQFNQYGTPPTACHSHRYSTRYNSTQYCNNFFPLPTGTNAKFSTCMASALKAIPI